jgi:hypothetical protein
VSPFAKIPLFLALALCAVTAAARATTVAISYDQPISVDRLIYNRNSHDANNNNLFHWALIRDQVARDVEIARISSAGGS